MISVEYHKHVLTILLNFSYWVVLISRCCWYNWVCCTTAW